MEQLLREMEEEQTIIILPECKTQEVIGCMEDFFQKQLGENVKDEVVREDKSLFDNDYHMDFYEADDGLSDLNDLDFEPKLESMEQSQNVKRNRDVRNSRQTKRVEKIVSNFDPPEICPICRPEKSLPSISSDDIVILKSTIKSALSICTLATIVGNGLLQRKIWRAITCSTTETQNDFIATSVQPASGLR